MMKLIPAAVTRGIAKQVLSTKHKSPHIFFVVGVAGTIGATFLACRSTLKLEKVLDEVIEDLETTTENGSVAVADPNVSYSDWDFARDRSICAVKGSAKLIRLYGPSIAVGSISIACLTGSHVQLTRRNTALASTLAIVSKAFDDYRVRVAAEIGEERELDIHRGLTEQTVEIEGKKQKVKVVDPNALSPYMRIFDATSPYWKREPELNLYFLKCQQQWLNHRLTATGHVFLNDVYDALGFEHTPAGQIVGWVLDGTGDGYIDFGIYEARNMNFISGHESCIVLDFNVDGPVYEKI